MVAETPADALAAASHGCLPSECLSPEQQPAGSLSAPQQPASSTGDAMAADAAADAPVGRREVIQLVASADGRCAQFGQYILRIAGGTQFASSSCRPLIASSALGDYVVAGMPPPSQSIQPAGSAAHSCGAYRKGCQILVAAAHLFPLLAAHSPRQNALHLDPASRSSPPSKLLLLNLLIMMIAFRSPFDASAWQGRSHPLPDRRLDFARSG